MKLPSLSPSTRTMALLGAVAVVLLFAGILTYVVCSQHLRSAESELQDKQKQVEDGRRIALRLNEAQDNYERAQSDLGCLETSVSTYAYVPTLLKQLEHLGQSLDLKVLSVRPEAAQPAAPPPIKRTSQDPEASPDTKPTSNLPNGSKAKAEQPKPYEELKIGIEVEGTYWRARDFMYRLTQFPKIVAVRQVQMSPANAADHRGSPKLSVKLNVTAFVFPAPKPGEAVDEQKPGVPTGVTSKGVTPDWRSSNEG